MQRLHILALDIGATSGRAILGTYSQENGLESAEEIHRFANGFVRVNGGLYWDHMRLYRGILDSLCACRARGIALDCIGVDTWAQDYAYVGGNGEVLGLPRCYRDPSNAADAGAYESETGRGPLDHARRCGVGKIGISTFRQLWHDRKVRKEILPAARCFLHMPYLMVYLLTGETGYDDSLMSIGELADARTGHLSPDTVRELGMERLFPPRRGFGTLIGRTNESVREETGYDGVPVACTDGHDTASAVSAIPEDGDFLWISSGTSNMLGAVVGEPCLSDECLKAKIYNTRLGDGRVCLMTGEAGMFYINRCVDAWRDRGMDVRYPDLTRYALEHRTQRRFDFGDVPDDAADMPAAVRAAVEKAGFDAPEDPFELYEAFCNSLAGVTCERLTALERVTGRTYRRLYVVSGGSQADGVNVRLAERLRREIRCGLKEAAATGNLFAQLEALGMHADRSVLAGASVNGNMRRFAP